MVSEQSTIGKIFAAIPAMIADCEHISKSQKNTQQGFNYRGIDQVYNAVNPLLAKYKVFPCSSILDEHREERTNKHGTVIFSSRIKMRYRFFADDGSYVDTEVIGEGMDSGDKASNKAMSIAYKYALFQLLCIPTAAIDPDGETHEVVAGDVAKAPPKPVAEEPTRLSKAQKDAYTALIGLIQSAEHDQQVDAAAKCCQDDFKAGKITKGQLDLLASVGRQKREALKAMEQLNERFEASGV